MGKLVVIRLGKGSFNTGFPDVLMQIGDDSKPYENLLEASLPPDSELDKFYENVKKHGFRPSETDKYNPSSALFKQLVSSWLLSTEFSSKWLELTSYFTANDEIRVILQAADTDLYKLPWHLWDFFDIHKQAEIAFSLPEYKIETVSTSIREKARILAILGNSDGIDITHDTRELYRISKNIQFLVQQDHKTINENLWDEESWDILFFAGHSKTSKDNDEGLLFINKTEWLKIKDLEYAIKTAISKGLKLAIFNSCDGLGIAKTLASWNIPQVIVMRQPVNDQVAQEFLKYFLKAFVKGNNNLYLALREAREQLQGLENPYPLASWLPIMYDQNFVISPLTWQQLNKKYQEPYQIAYQNPLKQSETVILNSSLTAELVNQLPNKVYSSLLRLNYTKQVRLFRTVFETQSIGACLIHGEEDYGQRWLLNRLIQLIPNSTTAKIIRISLGRKSQANYIDALWRQLAGRVRLTARSSPSEVVEQVYQLCEHQPVILIFDNVDEMPKAYMNEFMNNFWLPLVEKLKNYPPRTDNYRLLMFLLDHQGCVEEWDINLVDKIDTK